MYLNEECRWWKDHFFDKNMKSSFHVDVYEKCHLTIMFLLNIVHLNKAQRRDVNHVKRLFNEIDLITESMTTRKITFMIIIVQSFLWISLSNRFFQNAFKIVNNSTNIAFDTNFTFAKKNKVVQESTKIILDFDFTFAENVQIVQNSTKTISDIDITFAKNITIVQTSTKIVFDVDRTFANNFTIVRLSNVLICTSDNSIVDDIVDWLYRSVMQNFLTKDAIIIRMHIVTIEQNMLNVMIRDEDHDDQIMIDHEMTNFFELSVASLLFVVFRNSQKRSFKIKNRRYIHHNMNLVIWMLKIAKIISNFSHSKANFIKHHQFVLLHNKLFVNVLLKKENKKTYDLTKKNLKKHIIRLINAIITILFNFENAALYFVFCFQFIVIDEIIRTIELNVWNILKNYFKTFLVMIENEAQLRLIILNIHKNNDFKNSLKMSLFYKLKFLNQSSMFFNVQYRMINVIDFMILKFFYANHVTNDERTFIVDRFLSRAIINYFTKTYNVSSFVMLF